MWRWIDEGCKQFDGEPVDMRATIKALVSDNDDAGAMMAMRHAAAVSVVHDVALGGKCGLAIALLQAVVADCIDWKYVVEKFRVTAELN